ncbi:hypothetical protein MMC22_011817 [Lobaria immixta]|nr:hypothetical protein [Lobaria immixta]
MSAPTVNGDNASSQFLSHLTSYPVVSDSISTFKSNPYGKKSISIADHGYHHLIAPFIPYAQRPYGYVKPYVAKADSIADDGLAKVDSTFPIVKEDTQKIKRSVLEFAFLPLRLAGNGKDYVFSTYSGEYEKCGGDGYVSGGKAVITTSLVVTSDSLSWLGSFLAKKKQQTKESAKEAKEKSNN